MKKVFSTSEVPHVWARQTQEEGRNGGRGNIYFEGTKIYSYGSHFCMGNIFAPGIVFITDRTYSPTTSGHVSAVRYAVNHMRKLFVPFPEEVGANNARPEKNLQAWQYRIKDCLDTIASTRRRQKAKDEARGSLANIVRTVNEYLELTGQTLSKKWEPWNEATRKEFLMYFAAAQDEQAAADLQEKLLKAAKAKERAEKRKQAAALVKAQKELDAWTRGERDTQRYFPDPLPVRLRTDKTQQERHDDIVYIQTSKGARVSYEAGKLLFAMIKAGKDVKGHDVDGYTVISINGVLKIGCHVIEMEEVHRFAKAEGWE